MKNIHVAIADDHELVLEGFRMLMSKIRSVKVDFYVTNGWDLISQLKNAKVLPDLILLDLEMPGPGGKHTLQDLKKDFMNIKVLIISGCATLSQIVAVYRKGANGYISKGGSLAELEKAIHITIKTGHYLCPQIASKLPEEDARLLAVNKPLYKDLKHICNELTPVDVEIIQHISKGLKSKEIADIMNLSKRTVEGRRQKILLRTGSINTAELISKAKEKGWCS